MGIRPSDFLDAAKKMLAGKLEVDFRNATSRAYYSVFNLAQPLSDEIDPPKNPDVGSHTYLCSQLLDSGIGELVSIGYELKQCLAARKKADYELSANFEKVEAETTTHQCELLQEKISKRL